MSDGHGQALHVRPGDVYPPAAAGHDARRQRDEVLARDRQQHTQHRDGRLLVAETDQHDGRRVVTATAGGQVMAQFTVPEPDPTGFVASATRAVTIGEALQAAASDAPVGMADAAAVQAAETRATGLGRVVPGGVAAAAQKAAETNMRLGVRDEEKVRLSAVVGSATAVLPADKAVTREDARKVAAAAERNARGGAGGGSDVADAVAAAAEMNQRKMTR